MLHEHQRTCAPRLVSVSISTAVWIVICSDPTIFSSLSGCCFAYSSRTAISPGISCSASMISLRPHSARLMSATLYSSFAFAAAPDFEDPFVLAGLRVGLLRFGAVIVRLMVAPVLVGGDYTP